MKTKCMICGKEFEGRCKVCSPACEKERMRIWHKRVYEKAKERGKYDNTIIKKCHVCKKNFTTKNKKKIYCCQECARLAELKIKKQGFTHATIYVLTSPSGNNYETTDISKWARNNSTLLPISRVTNKRVTPTGFYTGILKLSGNKNYYGWSCDSHIDVVDDKSIFKKTYKGNSCCINGTNYKSVKDACRKLKKNYGRMQQIIKQNPQASLDDIFNNRNIDVPRRRTSRQQIEEFGIQKIIAMRESGMTYKNIANLVGCTGECIRQIIKREDMEKTIEETD